jgi:hypothetical protein
VSNQAGQTPIVSAPRRWDVLSSFMLQQGYKTFVEVGAKEGRTTGHILKTVPESRVIAIDPWMADPAPANGDATREDYKAWDFAKIEAEFWANVGENKDRCAQWRMTSEAAAKDWSFQAPFGRTPLDPPRVYEPIPADLIFIDALHDYESVKQDIALWWPKVRVGGCLSGHDFSHKWPGVERAVAEAFNLMQVGVSSDSVWFVLKTHEDQYHAA